MKKTILCVCAQIIALGATLGADSLLRAEETKCADRVVASSFGYDATDATDALQRAIDSGAKTVVVDKQPTPWIVRPINLRNNLQLILEEGVEILAKEGEFQNIGDVLLRAVETRNVRIVGEGRGATLRMRKRDYWRAPYKKSEWRHGISLLSAQDVVIENLTIAETGGDGVYLGVASRSGQPCRNVTIRNVDCYENNRQGISVISVDGLLIEDCYLRNTNGTAPEAGIDFEPNHETEQITNVTMRRVVSMNNAGDGFTFYLPNLAEHGHELSFTFEDCASVRNAGKGFAVTVANGERRTLSGCMRVKNVDLIGNRVGVAIRSKWSSGAPLVFENLRIVTPSADKKQGFKSFSDDARNTGVPANFDDWLTTTTDSGVSLIAVGTDKEPNGGFEFNNVEIIDGGESDAPRFLMTLRDASSEGVGFENITGSVRSTIVDGSSVETILSSETLPSLFPELAYRRVAPWDVAGLTASDAESVAISSELATAWRKRATNNSKSPTPLRTRGNASYYFYAEEGQETRWSLRQHKIGSYPPKEVEVNLTTPTGETVALDSAPPDLKERDYAYVAPTTGWYRLDANFGASALVITEKNVPILACARPSVDVFGSTGRFEFYVPQRSSDLGIRIVGSATERVTARLFNPSGVEVAVLENVSALGTWSTPLDEQGVPELPAPGFWTLELQRPTVGVLEDYIITILGAPALLR